MVNCCNLFFSSTPSPGARKRVLSLLVLSQILIYPLSLFPKFGVFCRGYYLSTGLEDDSNQT